MRVSIGSLLLEKGRRNWRRRKDEMRKGGREEKKEEEGANKKKNISDSESHSHPSLICTGSGIFGN